MRLNKQDQSLESKYSAGDITNIDEWGDDIDDSIDEYADEDVDDEGMDEEDIVDEDQSNNTQAPKSDENIIYAGEKPNINDVMLNLSCEVGSVSLSLKQLMQLRPKSVLEIGSLPPKVNLTLNGRIIAAGVLVEVKDNLGIKLTDIYNPK